VMGGRDGVEEGKGFFDKTEGDEGVGEDEL
jgi:hypothetical protein